MWEWLKQHWFRSRNSSALGDRGERLAADYLERHGLRIIERQYKGSYGELDLVALDADFVVFVEVKTRASMAAGDPTEAVTIAKQKKITQSAAAYLKRRGWLERRSRFDVVSILWNGPQGVPTIKHYPNAFEATGFGQLYS